MDNLLAQLSAMDVYYNEHIKFSNFSQPCMSYMYRLMCLLPKIQCSYLFPKMLLNIHCADQSVKKKETEVQTLKISLGSILLLW